MINQLSLGNIAEIQTGYSFRGAVEDCGDGIAVVQARDVTGMYSNTDTLPRVKQELPATKLLVDGDVILTARGSFRASVAKFSQPSVASSSLFMLRLKTKDITPEFLALYLNSAFAQSYLKQNARGATIQSINISDLSSLHIPAIPTSRQSLLVGLQQNVEKQASLLKSKLDVIEEIYINAVSNSLKGAA